MRKRIPAASALLLALAGPVAAQTLGELSAAMGAHHQAAAIGSGSASTARTARETITRHLPKPGGSLDGGDGRTGDRPMRTARAGRGGGGGGGSWSGPGKGGGGRAAGWVGPGNDRRRRR